MNKKSGVLSLRMLRAYVILFLPVMAMAQAEDPAVKDIEEPRQGFYIDAMAYAGASAGESKLDVLIQIPYEALTFTKQDDRYFASAEMTISVYDSAGALMTEKSWNEEIKGISFDESVAPGAYRLTEKVLSVRPGQYMLAAMLHDNETKRSSRIVRQILVIDFGKPGFSLSDIMLVSRLSVKGTKRSIVPNVSQNMGGILEPFFAFFDAYSDSTRESVRFVAAVYNEKGMLQLRADTVQPLRAGKNEVFIRVNHIGLTIGDYRLVIRALGPRDSSDGEVTSLASTNRNFSIRWKGMPRSLKDLDVAIDQLRYIAKEGEFSRMKEAKTLDEKQKCFLDFWQKRSFNPNVSRNLRMEQYYARVDYANKHFGHYYEGWRTDMGMIYIIFGPPSNVDRHPFDVDSRPYEIWSYYDINYQFSFVDQTGFGDYKLTNPAWEVWQRPRVD